jgi:hypothetical protein
MIWAWLPGTNRSVCASAADTLTAMMQIDKALNLKKDLPEVMVVPFARGWS